MKISKILAVFLSLAAVISFTVAVNAEGNGKERGIKKHESSLLGSKLEVHIGDDGRILVRGAKVTSVSGTTLNASVSWGSYSMNWIILTSPATKFQSRPERNNSLAGIQAGDVISFKGTLDSNSSTPSVNASMIKNWSVYKVKKEFLEKRIFEGTLKSISGATLPAALVVSVEGQDFTVIVPANISILGRNWLTTSIANFKAGDNIKVYGSARVDNTSIIDAALVRNTSISL